MPLKNSDQSPLQPPMSRGAPDDFQTPIAALTPLLPYLKKEWTIWECGAGKGNLSNALADWGYKVIATDILTGQDFLKWQPEKFDCIVTNPPYSLKQEFLTRCYDLKKPFALLLPLTTFETRKRQELFEKYGVQVIFWDKRINFETPSGNGSGAWFAVAWFSNWLNLPKDLIFERWRAR
jgi:hypothetical protein